MTVATFANGDVLMAGSLNSSINARNTFYSFNGSQYSSNTSGTNTTIRDEYITSGNLAITNKIMVQTGWRIAEAQAANHDTSLRIAIGGSATSPTLTAIGSITMTTNTTTTQPHIAVYLAGVGSTTVDNASVPVLVRMSAGIESTNVTALLYNTVIQGVQ